LTAREPDTRYEISDSVDFLHLFISEVRSEAYAQSSLKMKKAARWPPYVWMGVDVWQLATRPRLPKTSEN